MSDAASAFPVPDNVMQEEGSMLSGMTMRDYFAARAMAAIIIEEEQRKENPSSYDKVAQWAYEHADAMLKARKIKKGR